MRGGPSSTPQLLREARVVQRVQALYAALDLLLAADEVGGDHRAGDHQYHCPADKQVAQLAAERARGRAAR